MTAPELLSWPKGHYKRQALISMDAGFREPDALVLRPDRYRFFHEAATSSLAIARGAGFSFSPASFGRNSISVDMTAFDRILGFDSATGAIEVEAGITLGRLFEYLAPRGFYLPVQPGHHKITVGGCVAADIHGKNPARDGTFIEQIDCIRLFHPSHGTIEVSHERTPEIFRATCGGLGLTGIILSLRLRPKPLPSDTLSIARQRVENITAGAVALAERAPYADLAYGWFDFGPGSASGQGVVITGNFLGQSRNDCAPLPRDRDFSAASRARLPISVMSPACVKIMNSVHWVLLTRANAKASIAKILYPTRYNEPYLSLFGSAGFYESQVIISNERAGDYVASVREWAAKLGTVITLAVAKPFSGTSDLIRFAGTGISIAVEVARTKAGTSFMDGLNDLTTEFGGRPNVIKNSRLSRRAFEAAYPECDRFRSILREWDSRRMFRSELSERLGL